MLKSHCCESFTADNSVKYQMIYTRIKTAGSTKKDSAPIFACLIISYLPVNQFSLLNQRKIPTITWILC